MVTYVPVAPNQQTISATPTISSWTATSLGGDKSDTIMQLGPWNPGWGGQGSPSGKIRIREIDFGWFVNADPALPVGGGDVAYISLSEGIQTGDAMIVLGRPATDLSSLVSPAAGNPSYAPITQSYLAWKRRGCIVVPQSAFIALQLFPVASWASNPTAQIQMAITWEPLA